MMNPFSSRMQRAEAADLRGGCPDLYSACVLSPARQAVLRIVAVAVLAGAASLAASLFAKASGAFPQEISASQEIGPQEIAAPREISGQSMTSACVGNETNFTLALQYRWHRRDAWTDIALDPGETARIVRPGSLTARQGVDIRFSAPMIGPVPSSWLASDKAAGPSVKRYRLPVSASPGGTCSAPRGNLGLFRLDPYGSLDLYRP